MKISRPHVLRMAASIVLLISMPACTKEAKTERSLKAAMELFNKGDYVASEIELKNALKSDPGNFKAIKQMGLIRNRQGAHFEAAGILSQAARMDAKDDAVGVAFAKSLFSLGFVPDSRKALIEVLDRTPSNGDALIVLADTSLTPEWMDEFKDRLKVAGKKTPQTKVAEALIELRRGLMESGTMLVDEVLKEDPEMARAHGLKAAILSSREEPDEALAEMKLAAETGGSRSNESIGYARMLMARDKKDEAIAYLETITAATPDFLPAWATLGQIAYTEKDNVKATDYFAKVLAKDPVDVATAMTQAQIWMQGEAPDKEKAVSLMEKLTSAFQGRAALDLMLAKCYLSADNMPKAGAALDKVMALAPDLSEAGILRAQLFLKEGKTSDGIPILEKLRGKEPNNTAARDLLIDAYRVSGRNDDAVALMREKAKADASDPKDQMELGQLLSSMGKDDEARTIFQDAVETFAGNLNAVANLAAMDVKQGKPDDAMNRIDGYIKEHPESSEAFALKGNLQMSMKQPEEAEKSLEKALELKADNKAAFLLLLRMKQGEEALVLFDRYLKVFPDDSQARLSRGFLLQQIGKNEEAKAAFQSLIDDGLELAAAHNNIAGLQSGPLKDMKSAVEHARKARELDPEQPAIADTLGWIEWQMGNFPEALPLLTEAASKITNSAEVVYHLGMAQAAMGQAEDAIASLTKATSVEADYPGKADAAKQLAMLQDAGSATLEEVQKRVADNPKDVLSRLRLAELLAAADKPQDAYDAYQQVIDENAKLPAAWVGQARLLAGPLNDPAKALATATKARELAPNDPQALAVLGSAKLRNGNQEEAYGLLKDAAGRLGDDASVLYDQARAAYSLGRVAEADSVMKKVAGMNAPESAAATAFLAMTSPDAAKQPGISAEVEKALAKDPADVPALMLQAELATAAGKNPEADYLEILKHSPNFDPARVRLAAIYLNDPAKLDEALSLATKARASMRDDPELTRILAMANFKKGEMKYAAQLLSELAIKRPLTPAEQVDRGLALAGSKEPEKAKQALEEALKAGPSEEDAARAKEALGKLEETEEEKK